MGGKKSQHFIKHIFLEQKELRFDSVTEKNPSGFAEPVQIPRQGPCNTRQEVKKER